MTIWEKKTRIVFLPHHSLYQKKLHMDKIFRNKKMEPLKILEKLGGFCFQ